MNGSIESLFLLVKGSLQAVAIIIIRGLMMCFEKNRNNFRKKDRGLMLPGRKRAFSGRELNNSCYFLGFCM
jgi:hypothetical protein